MDIRRRNPPTPRSTGSQTTVTCYQLLQEALRCGVTAREWFALTGLHPDGLAEPTRRIEAGTLFDVWEAIMRRLRDPAFPVRAARNAQRDQRSVVSLLVRASSTVDEALSRAVRYNSVFSTVYSLRVQPWRDGAVVTLDGLGVERLGERCEAEYMVTEIVTMIRTYATDRRNNAPVHFAHPAPPRTAAHRRVFGPALRFDSSRTEVVIPAGTLRLPLRTAQPGLAAILAGPLEDMTTRRSRPRPYSLQVRQILTERLGKEPVTATTMARRLMVSERTLHRRLAAEGTTLRAVLDETRCALAVAMINEDRSPIKEVASALGFSSARSLHRAYRRWTGTTPRGRLDDPAR
jgi:AraC-like DNA-binding protein